MKKNSEMVPLLTKNVYVNFHIFVPNTPKEDMMLKPGYYFGMLTPSPDCL